MRHAVIPRTVYKFQGVNSHTCEIPLVTRIDSPRWVSGSFTVRLHDKTTASSTAAFNIAVENVSYTDDEPSVAYLGDAIATVQVLNGDTSPKLYVEEFTGAIGDQVRVVLYFVQGSVTGETSFAISVEIDAREA